MSKLSSLIVDLQADTASLKQGLDEAKNMLGGLEKKVDQATKAVGAMFLLDKAKEAIVGLTEFVHAGAEAADQAGKMAAASGISVESFSRLSYAADLANISNEELSSSLSKLNKNITAAATGGKDQSAVFKGLGIAVTNANGSIRSADEVMADVAEKFSHMENGAAKAALAQELFGKSGARLIPLLNEGRAGLKAMADEADKFGLTVTKEGAAASNQFNDALTKMKKIGEGLARTVAQDLAPSMSKLADEFLNSAKNSNSLKTAAEGIAIVFRSLVTAGLVVVGLLQHIGITIGGLASALTNLATGNFKGAKEALQGTADELNRSFEETKKRLAAIWNTDKTPLDEEKKAVTENADSIVKDIERKKKAMEEYTTALAKLTKTTTEIQFQTLTFGFNDVELLQARTLFGDIAEEIKKTGAAGEVMAGHMMDAAKALHQLKMAQKAKDAVAGIKLGLGKDQTAFVSNPAKRMGAKMDPAALKYQAKIVDAAIAMDNKVKAAFAAAGSAIVRGVGSAIQGLLGAMGGIGNIIGNFITTFKNEGFWEALIGAVGEILQAAPAFADVISIASGILQVVVGSLNGLIKGIGDLLGAIGGVIEILINALKPLFDVIGQVLSDLAPLLYLMGMTIKVGITPIVKLLSFVFKALSPILKILFDVIRLIVLGSFYILKGLAWVWNGILGALSGFFRWIGNFEIFGAKPFGFLLNWADSIDKAKITTVGLDEAIDELKNANYDSVKAMQEQKTEEYKAAGATEKMAKAAEKAAAGLTNVPALLKVNRLRGLSMDSTKTDNNFNLYIDGRQVAMAVERSAQDLSFDRGGKRGGRFGGI